MTAPKFAFPRVRAMVLREATFEEYRRQPQLERLDGLRLWSLADLARYYEVVID